MAPRTVDPAEYHVLKRAFDEMRPHLLEKGKRVDVEGAWARAMLVMVPAFLLHIERERKALIPALETLEGVTNAMADVLKHCIRITASPDERHGRLEAILRHFHQTIAPRLTRSEGNVILPTEALH